MSKTQIIYLLYLISFLSVSAFSQKKPNILFILTDDQSQRDVGAYGNSLLSTPHMDRIINEGMKFENAFTSTAMCVPSRSSLLTGLHPMRHGAHPNHAKITPGTRSVAHYLAEAGYKVGLIGKTHIKPIDSFGFHYVNRLRDYAWDSKLTRQEMKKAMDTLSLDGNPFALFICIANPHVPWPGEWRGDPNDITLPSYLYDNDSTRLAVSRYYAHVEFADTKVGEAISVAEELGFYEDMVVFFSSDHGAEVIHGKYTLYDAGINVPLAVKWAGKVKPGSISAALVQFVDVTPTLIELVGGRPIDSLDGQSFLNIMTAEGTDTYDYIYATSSKDGKKTDYPIKAIRSKRYKYILNPMYYKTFTSWITDASLGDKWPGYGRHYAYWLSWISASISDPHAAQLVKNYIHRPMEEFYDLAND
ncbi:MAG: sulfatase, partial [Bacteroidota bacterium]